LPPTTADKQKGPLQTPLSTEAHPIQSMPTPTQQTLFKYICIKMQIQLSPSNISAEVYKALCALPKHPGNPPSVFHRFWLKNQNAAGRKRQKTKASEKGSEVPETEVYILLKL